MIRWLHGDCRETLPTLEQGSIQACITSPPYYGLRDYGTPALVWGGNTECDHQFQPVHRLQRSGVNHDGGAGYREHEDRRYIVASSLCACGAWLGSLGLEPTPELYIEHLVECFRHVRRVLRDDGTLWVNLGDSYAGSSNGSNDSRDVNKNRSLSLHPDKYVGQKPGTPGGYKPKDLMMMPFRVAMALQADGWWLRSVIPWVKRNAMPESVTDRPSTSVEYVFLLSKSARYFYDADAVRVANSAGSFERYKPGEKIPTFKKSGGSDRANESFKNGQVFDPTGRNRRNGDWFFESWQGLLLDEQDDPLALVVNPTGFKQAHFATFPPKLVEPMLKASTRPGDTVLDPFGGAGTVGLVADRHGRHAVLCELKQEYGAMGTERIQQDAPLFHAVAVTSEPTPVIDKQAAVGNRTYTGFNERWDAKEATS